MKSLLWLGILLLTVNAAVAQRFVRSLDNVAALVADNPNNVMTNVWLSGYYAPADGGGGPITWIEGDTSAPDNGMVFMSVHPLAPVGRWVRPYTGSVNVLHYGTQKEGSEASTPINAAINYVNAVGGGEVFVPEGIYNVAGTLGNRIIFRSNVRFRTEPGTEFRSGTQTTLSVMMQINADGGNVTNVHVLGPMTLRGSLSSTTTAYGLQVNSQHETFICRYITIQDVTCTEFQTDGFQVGGNPGGFPRDVIMDRIIGRRNGRHGLGVIQVDGLTVRNSIFDFNAGHSAGLSDGVDIEPDNNLQCRNVLLERCTFTDNQNHGLDAKKGVGIAPEDIRAVNCISLRNGGDGFRFLDVLRGEISGSKSASNVLQGAVLTTCSQVTVNGLDSFANGQNGIQLASSKCTVEFSKLYSNGGSGIQVPGAGSTATLAEHNAIRGNLMGTNTLNGIALSGAGYNEVSGNRVQGNGQEGILISGSSQHNKVFGNRVEANGQTGPDNSIDNIRIASNSSWNTIQDNTIRKSLRYNTGVAQAGAISSITLESYAVDMDSYYVGQIVTIINGTGVGQSRTISDYVGGTRVATVSSAWGVTPDSNSRYEVSGAIRPASGIRVLSTNCFMNLVFLNDTYRGGQTIEGLWDSGSSTKELSPVPDGGFTAVGNVTLSSGDMQINSNAFFSIRTGTGVYNPVVRSDATGVHAYLSSFTGGDAWLRAEGDNNKSIRVLASNGRLHYAAGTPDTIQYLTAGREMAAVTIGANLTFVGGTLSASGGGAGTPGGADTQLQFNNAGAFGGSAAGTYSIANLKFTLDRLNVPYSLERGVTNATGGAIDFDLRGEPVLRTTNSVNQVITLTTPQTGEYGAWLVQLTGNGVNTLSFVAPAGFTLQQRWGTFASTPRSGVTEYFFEKFDNTTIYYDTAAPLTLADFPTMATDRLLGRDTAGTGFPEEITLSQALDFVGSAAQGDILYRGAATWTRLAAGTSGQFLKTQGAGANPIWDTAGAGTGDFVGPASSTDNAIVRFDGATGKLGQNSVVTIGDTGNFVMGDASQASLTFGANLSGASDPTITFQNAGISLGSGAVTAGGGFLANGTTTGSITLGQDGAVVWSGRSRIKSAANADLTLLNAAENSFETLSWGPRTTSFSLLQTTNAEMALLLGDESAYTALRTSTVYVGTTNVAGELALKAPLADPVFTSSLQLPNGASPTTDAFGEIAADNDAWAASRGAVQFFDGTANTYLVGTLASDAPSNGQVPTWNTGGTITWETPSAGAGDNWVASGTTNSTLAGEWFAHNGTLTNTLRLTGNSALSTPIAALTGTWISGGSATTTKPHFLIEPSGATSTAWSTGGTGLGINAASGFAGSLIEAQLNGATRMTLSSAGALNTAGGIDSGGPVRATSTSNIGVLSRLRISSDSNGQAILENTAQTGFTKLQLGRDDASPDANVTVQAASGVGSNISGGGISVAGGQGTGTGVGGFYRVQTSVTNATASTAGSLVTRQYVYAGDKELTESSATAVFTLTLAAGKYASVEVLGTTHADDNTDFTITTDNFNVSLAAKGTAISSNISSMQSSTIGSAGSTLTTSWDVLDNGNNTYTLRNNAVASLTQVRLKTGYQVWINSDDVSTLTP